MSGILAYALHYEGAFNKNSLGGVSEAARLAAELGCEAHAVVIGDVSDELAATLGNYGATKVFRCADAPEGLAQPVVDVMAQIMDDNGHDYALFGGGLLGFEIGAGLAARLNAGVTMEVTQVNVVDGKLTAERPIHGDSSISTSSYKDRGIIIGRLNAFETAAPSDAAAEVEDVDVELSAFSTQATMVTARRAARRRRRHRGRGHPRRRRPRPRQARGLRALRGARRGARRRGRRDARGRRRRLVPVLDADRPDRQDRLAEALPGGRHLRRDPAQGRLSVLGEHRGDQQGLQRPDLRVLRPRHRRRPQQDPAQAHRGREGEEGVGEAAWPAATAARRRPAQFPPPVDPQGEFIKHGLDAEDELIEVGVAIVGGGTAGLSCANRLLQLLADDEELLESLGEVPVAVIEKAKTCGGHNLSGAVMRPGPLRGAASPT